MVTCLSALGACRACSLFLEVLVYGSHPATSHVESLAKLAWLLLCALLQWNLPGARVCFIFFRFLVGCRLYLALSLWSFEHVLLHLADTRNNGFEKALRTNKVVPVLINYTKLFLLHLPI